MNASRITRTRLPAAGGRPHGSSLKPPAWEDVEVARDWVIGIVDPNQPPDPEEALLDQINVLAVYNTASGSGFGRGTALKYAVESVVWMDPIPTYIPDDEHNLGIGAETDSEGFEGQDFLDALEMILMRVTVCPGDYNRDGVVDNNDVDEFVNDSQFQVPYSDWNFDRVSDGWQSPHIGHPGPWGIDWHKFITGHDLGCQP